MLALTLLAALRRALAMSVTLAAPGTIWLTKAAAGEAAISRGGFQDAGKEVLLANRCQREIDIQFLARDHARHQLQVDQRHTIVTREFRAVACSVRDTGRAGACGRSRHRMRRA